jgi:hypothetical protein
MKIDRNNRDLSFSNDLMAPSSQGLSTINPISRNFTSGKHPNGFPSLRWRSVSLIPDHARLPYDFQRIHRHDVFYGFYTMQKISYNFEIGPLPTLISIIKHRQCHPADGLKS